LAWGIFALTIFLIADSIDLDSKPGSGTRLGGSLPIPILEAVV